VVPPERPSPSHRPSRRELCSRLSWRRISDAPVARVCGKDVPLPYAANLERLALPQISDVVEAAKAVTYR